jgi:hypothetical protein
VAAAGGEEAGCGGGGFGSTRGAAHAAGYHRHRRRHGGEVKVEARGRARGGPRIWSMGIQNFQRLFLIASNIDSYHIIHCYPFQKKKTSSRISGGTTILL